MRFKVLWIAGLMLAATAGQVQAAMVVGFDIPQQATGYTSIAAIAGGSPDVSASNLTRTNTLSGSAFGNHFYFSGWDTTVNLTKFYATTLTVAAGKQLTLADLTYSVEDTSSGGGSNFFVRTSLDSFSSNVDSFAALAGGLVTNRTTNLSSLGAIIGTIEFRFYATTLSSGTAMGFANHLPGGAGGGLPDVGQNIRFNGNVTEVPEPTSIAMWGLGAIGMMFARRKRQQKKLAA